MDTTNVAQVGTLTLEFATLTKHTGNATYQALAEKATKALIALADPIPGIPAQGYSPESGESIGAYVVRRYRPAFGGILVDWLLFMHRLGEEEQTATLST